MNYAKIDEFEYVNGEGIGISLFVSGCNFHCKNCFNKEAWDFSYGSEWTEEAEKSFLELLNNEHIQRVSILGGEPLCDENVHTVMNLISHIRIEHPEIKIWLYTGYKAELKTIPVYKPEYDDGTRYSYFWFSPVSEKHEIFDYGRELTAGIVDVLVDGQYIDEQRNLSLKFKGSENQRVIDVQQSLKEQKLIIYGER